MHNLTSIAASELIINPDGSIYHLKLKPGELSKTIITVGDPDRIDQVTQYFDDVSFERKCREFRTVTGQYKGKKISVISTGIGTDNIDIVFNEIDALFNIDFDTRMIKQELSSLDIIRLGTSGTIRSEIALDSILISRASIGMEGLLNYYKSEKTEMTFESFKESPFSPYFIQGDQSLCDHFKSIADYEGITITANGFYGPQNRQVRLNKTSFDWMSILKEKSWKGYNTTNLEMETAGIYALAKLLGHRAISINALLANRKNGTFSKNPGETVDKMIRLSLDKIRSL